MTDASYTHVFHLWREHPVVVKRCDKVGDILVGIVGSAVTRRITAAELEDLTQSLISRRYHEILREIEWFKAHKLDDATVRELLDSDWITPEALDDHLITREVIEAAGGWEECIAWGGYRRIGSDKAERFPSVEFPKSVAS
jgi:hypothetical protein